MSLKERQICPVSVFANTERVIITISKLDDESLSLQMDGEEEIEKSGNAAFYQVKFSPRAIGHPFVSKWSSVRWLFPFVAESCWGHQSKRGFTKKVGKQRQKANTIPVTSKIVHLALYATLLLFVMEQFLGESHKSREIFSFEQQISELGKESMKFSEEKEKE